MGEKLHLDICLDFFFWMTFPWAIESAQLQYGIHTSKRCSYLGQKEISFFFASFIYKTKEFLQCVNVLVGYRSKSCICYSLGEFLVQKYYKINNR